MERETLRKRVQETLAQGRGCIAYSFAQYGRKAYGALNMEIPKEKKIRVHDFAAREWVMVHPGVTAGTVKKLCKILKRHTWGDNLQIVYRFPHHPDLETLIEETFPEEVREKVECT